MRTGRWKVEKRVPGGWKTVIANCESEEIARLNMDSLESDRPYYEPSRKYRVRAEELTGEEKTELKRLD